MEENKIEPTAKELAVEFFKWCNEPTSSNGFMRKFPKAVCQAPDYKDFIVINESGKSILGEGVYLTHEQLFDYWLEQRNDR